MLLFSILLACTEPKETDDANLVDAQWEQEGEILCENPELRSENPLVLADFGEAWNNQSPAGYSPDEFDWFGGEGVVVADLSGNGLLDIFVPTQDQNLLFVQNELGVFQEESATRLPPEQPQVTVGASAGDMDGDGDLDMIVLNINEEHQLLQNNDGVFSLVGNSGLMTRPYYSPSASWGDLNGDGTLELFLSTSGAGPNESPPWEGELSFELAGPNGLYNFEESTLVELPLPELEPEPYSCCTAMLDINLDGYQDVYVVNDFGVYVQPNLLLLGSQDGTLTNHSGSGLDIGMFGMGLSVGAINDDAYPDFVVTDWGRNWMFLSDGSGGWYDGTQSQGLLSEHPDQHIAWGVESVDVDNDGDLDIWMGFGQLDIPPEEQDNFDNVGLYNPRYQPDALYLQDEQGQFADVAPEWGIDRLTITRGSLWVDLNRDGFLDYISTAIDGPVLAYLGQCDESAWLEISLEQEGGNRHAIGASIEVWAGDAYWKEWMMAGGELSSSGPPLIHVGLGDVDMVDRIRVTWPDQSVSEQESMPTRQFIHVRR